MTVDEVIEQLQRFKRRYGGSLLVVDVNDDPVDFEYNNNDDGEAIVVS